MTDRIDLDDLETGADEDEAESGNRGDWLGVFPSVKPPFQLAQRAYPDAAKLGA